MPDQTPATILISPLDWGLGHATRCIPIIYELLSQKVRVIIAASGPQQSLLKQEFDSLEYLEIPGYDINYKKGILLKWALIFRVPGFLRQIKRENEWLKALLKERRIDAVISDNRYGLYNDAVPSIFITHQLGIQSGVGTTKSRSLLPPIPGTGFPRQKFKSKLGDRVDRKIAKFHFKMIRKFSSCWVPDEEGRFSLAGKLSHPSLGPLIPTKYIGILSRFQPVDSGTIKNTVLIILSGPEPQRTELENFMLTELKRTIYHVSIVRGVPSSAEKPGIHENVTIYNHLKASVLNKLVATAEIVISRSGYSTVMDLMKLGKPAILIPTPGQTEQEYLAEYLHQKKWMYKISQKNFGLDRAIQLFTQASLFIPQIPKNNLPEAVQHLLKEIAANELMNQRSGRPHR